MVDSTVPLLDPRDGSSKPLRLRFRSLQGQDGQPASCLISLSTDTETADSHGTGDQKPWDKDQSGEAFFNSISHDTRTPLNSLMGVLQLLSNTQLNPQQERYLEIAQAAGKNVLVVTDELVDLNKLDAGHYQSKSPEFSLYDLLQKNMNQFAPRAINKGLSYYLDICSSVPDFVCGDTKAVSYILKSLLENAVKHTESGSVTLQANCARIQQGKALVTLELRDTGRGIEQSQLHKLQTLFSGTTDSTIPRDGCARLGLTLCQRFARLLECDLQIESEEEKGTQVTVTIPLQWDRKETSDSDSMYSSLDGRRVLALDENHINLEYIQGVLEPFNIEVEQLTKGRDALQKIKSAQSDGKPFDLVLVDFCLDDMDGLELISQLSMNESTAGPKLIMLSTIDQIISAPEMQVRGISAALTKPIRSADLLSTVSKIFYSEPRAATHIDRLQFCQSEPASGSAASTQSSTAITHNVKYAVVPEIDLYRDQLLARDETLTEPNSEDVNLDAPLILIVEDNPVNLLVAEETLLDAGYRVDVATNGEEALSRLEQGGVDLVLMDCQMPVLDGFAATRRIRTLEREKGVLVPRQLPVVALTANATKGDREKCLASGMNDYIAKPFRPKSLFAVLNQYIRSPLGQSDDAGDWPSTGTG